MNENLNKTKKFKVPHTYVILFTMILIMCICTYVIPAGQYTRMVDPETNRNLVVPNSFQTVDQNPVGIFDLLKAIPNGMVESAEIIFFIFIVGGSFNIVTSTGAIQAGISKAASGVKGKENLMVPLVIILFSLGGATFGMSEETIVFIPIGITLARALGYDAMVGMAMVSLGAACGFNAGFMNPFTVGVAQGIAELKMFSGIELRLVIWIVLVTITSIYVLRYGKKVKLNPEKSIVRSLEIQEKGKVINQNQFETLTTRHILVLLTVVIGMGIMIFGVFTYEWYIIEIAAVFIAIGLVSGFIAGHGPSRMAEDFVLGAKDIALGALVVGVARGILVVMNEGMIMDSIVNALAGVITALPKAVASVGMMIIQIIINFFIPSGSGQAAATMPIMTPLADVIGITRQTAVLAYQFGDGFTNSIIPTSGTLLAALSMAKIPYEKWVKFVAPLMGIWVVVGAIFMIIATTINYGPF